MGNPQRHRRSDRDAAPRPSPRHVPRTSRSPGAVEQALERLRLAAPTAMITQGYLARHFQGRSGMRDPALLDVAQDYALKHLHDQGAFELGIVLKGGTSLRKLRAGNAGRFSTDMDFATPDLETAGFLLDTLDGAELFDVRFSLAEREATRAKLIVDTPLGRPAIPARVEISPRKLWLPTKLSTPVALAVHAGYESTPPAIPAPALEESLAEILAAVSRRSIGRLQEPARVTARYGVV